MSENNKDTRAASRRDFLKKAAVAVGAAGAAAAASPAQATTPAAREQDGGYRETDHVRKYYELAR